MLKIRQNCIAVQAGRALDCLHAIEDAVAALDNDDLLDFADIFAGGDPTPLREIAEAAMKRRGISL